MTTPRATYRFQLRAEFGLDDAAAQLDYLARLGVSHAYLSPPLQAAAGSAHGYDGVDPTRVSDELGGEAARARFVAALKCRGLGQVIDIVPNHLSTSDPENRWWWDVLRCGRDSRYARHFDIDWESPDPRLAGKIVLPVLGNPLAEELRGGSIRVGDHAGERVVRYFDQRFPLAPGTEDGALDDVLARQHYLLAHWRDGQTALTHRRFFDVTTLVGVRVEDEDVFDDVHRTVLAWHAAGEVDGLRVDHPDGLADPTGYTQRLAAAAPGAWLVVEKILEPGEQLRADWPVAGTTGYDALNTIGGLFVDPRSEHTLSCAYAAITGTTEDFATVARRARAEVVGTLLRPELERVSVRAARVLDAPLEDVRRVVAAFVSEMPVYRTYVRPGEEPSAADRAAAAEAVSRIAAHHPDVDAALAAQLASVVLELGSDPSGGDDAHDLVRQIQQLSGPAMAKGVEDTAFYRYTRFIGVNEVGGDPAHASVGLAEFHEANSRRAEQWPATMIATSTHDTKRSEDVRARLAVLSEIADVWTAVLTRWCERSGAWWAANAAGVPRDPHLEVLLHQTLVGAHPLPAERAHPYLEKAMREAKNVTNWIDPDEAFECAAHGLLDHLLTDEAHRRELDALVLSIRVPGRVNALSQKLIALTVPGVPDIYQGTELWSLDLVDPDNRRPVDYGLRADLLERLASGQARPKQSMMSADDEGIAKLHVVVQALDVRRRHESAFIGPAATYTPLLADGAAADCVVAFRRGDGDDAVITVAPRLAWQSTLDGGWRDTTIDLPQGIWRDVLSGARLPGGTTALTTLTASFPMALLERA